MIGERVVADIRKAAFAKAISLSPSYYETVMTGEVISRINTDTTLVLTVVGSTVSVALRNVLILFGGLALMLTTSPKLTMLALLVVPLVVAPMLVLGRLLRRVSRENQDQTAESSASASELLLALQAVQANTHEADSRTRFNRIVERTVMTAYRRVKIRAAMTIVIILLTSCGVVAVVWTGILDVRSDEMTAGELTQFVIFAVMVAGSVAALSEVWGEIVRAAGAADRLVELLNAGDAVIDPPDPSSPASPAEGSLCFNNVAFRYPMRPEFQALHDISFSVNAGETIALVGPSGAGKSTIFQLLLRFFDPQSGQILLDGINIRQMRRRGLPEQYRSGSAGIRRFSPTAHGKTYVLETHPHPTTMWKRRRRSAAIHHFLSSLPDGYDSWVGERGIMLSGGQKQRIAIARAILRDAPLLLLDEATSSLDSESEHEVQAAIDELARHRTTLIVAHRLATVKKADRILVFENGGIVAEGSHDQLIEANGLYARFARLQLIESADT